MIERYTLPEMGEIWNDKNRFDIWLQIEVLACEAQAKLGVIPKGALNAIKKRAAYDIDRINAIEAEVNHDVIAFLTAVGEHVGESSRYIHYGLTSSDILDTALSVQIQRAGGLILGVLEDLIDAIGKRAWEHEKTPTMGRTHGVFAEPMSLGQKFAVWYQQLARDHDRIRTALDNCAVGKLSGAVGNFAHIDPRVEEYVCTKLGLTPAPVSNQIVQRDRHAGVLSAFAICGGTLERIALEIRHLQRSEVREMMEGFTIKQKGSSAMPHKRNPILCERLCGMARLLRAYAMTAMENIALWHERDISHSSVERVTFPDATIIIHYMLVKTRGLIENLQIDKARMLANIHAGGGVAFSQRVLLALTQAGMSREDAYATVQKHALHAWNDGGSFRDLVSKDSEVRMRLGKPGIDACFDLTPYLAHAPTLLNRAVPRPRRRGK
jgi:adenylosuccinate lyase